MVQRTLRSLAFATAYRVDFLYHGTQPVSVPVLLPEQDVPLAILVFHLSLLSHFVMQSLGGRTPNGRVCGTRICLSAFSPFPTPASLQQKEVGPCDVHVRSLPKAGNVQYLAYATERLGLLPYLITRNQQALRSFRWRIGSRKFSQIIAFTISLSLLTTLGY